jgi:hypothetical protein
MEEEPRAVDEVELLRYGGYAEENDVDVPRAVLVARWSASLERETRPPLRRSQSLRRSLIFLRLDSYVMC